MSQKRQQNAANQLINSLVSPKTKTFFEKIDFLVSNWHRNTFSENGNKNLIPLDLIELIKIFASHVIIFDIYDKNFVKLKHDRNITKISHVNFKDIDWKIHIHSLVCKNSVKLNHNLKIKCNNNSNYYFEIGVCTPNYLILREKCMCIIPQNKSKYDDDIGHKNNCFDLYWCVEAYGNKIEYIRDIQNIFSLNNNYNIITHDEVKDESNHNKYKLRGRRKTMSMFASNIPKIKKNDIISVKLNGKNILFVLNNKKLYKLKIDNIDFGKEFFYYMSFYESCSYDICN